MNVVDARLHDLRMSWRQLRLTKWLSKSRIDSKVAKDNSFALSLDQLEGLRKSLRDVSAHELAVACGGVVTPALNFERLRAVLPPIDICPYCGANEVPGCLHVLWDCSAFADVRVLPAPECPLAKRLGWDLHGSLNQALLRQMGQIRQLEAQKRLRELRQQQ
jgi:hypothetical protein